MLDGIYPADREHISAILDETHTLSRVVDDLRTLSVAENGALKLELEASDMSETPGRCRRGLQRAGAGSRRNAGRRCSSRNAARRGRSAAHPRGAGEPGSEQLALHTRGWGNPPARLDGCGGCAVRTRLGQRATGQASPPRICRTFSTASINRPICAAAGWGWRSARGWWRPTAARSRPKAGPAAARRLSLACLYKMWMCATSSRTSTRDYSMNNQKILPPTWLLICLVGMLVVHFSVPSLRIIPIPWNLTGLLP